MFVFSPAVVSRQAEAEAEAKAQREKLRLSELETKARKVCVWSFVSHVATPRRRCLNCPLTRCGALLTQAALEEARRAQAEKEAQKNQKQKELLQVRLSVSISLLTSAHVVVGEGSVNTLVTA